MVQTWALVSLHACLPARPALRSLACLPVPPAAHPSGCARTLSGRTTASASRLTRQVGGEGGRCDGGWARLTSVLDQGMSRGLTYDFDSLRHTKRTGAALGGRGCPGWQAAAPLMPACPTLCLPHRGRAAARPSLLRPSHVPPADCVCLLLQCLCLSTRAARSQTGATCGRRSSIPFGGRRRWAGAGKLGAGGRRWAAGEGATQARCAPLMPTQCRRGRRRVAFVCPPANGRHLAFHVALSFSCLSARQPACPRATATRSCRTPGRCVRRAWCLPIRAALAALISSTM